MAGNQRLGNRRLQARASRHHDSQNHAVDGHTISDYQGITHKVANHAIVRKRVSHSPHCPSIHSWVSVVAILGILTVLVIGAIIISSVSQSHVQLDDGTVWVTSLHNRKVARLNVRLGQTDASLASSSRRFDIMQHDNDTVLAGDDTATVISPTDITLGEPTKISMQTTTFIGGEAIAFLDSRTGYVWAGKTSQINDLKPYDSKPLMKLGRGGRIAVAHTGVVYGYRPADAMVLKADAAHHGRSVQWISLNENMRLEANDFTVVDDQPIIASGATLYWNNGSTKLPLSLSKTLRLQAPPNDDEQHGWFAAATDEGLFTVAWKNRKPHITSLLHRSSSSPAQPTSLGGCVYAAWAQQAHNYLKQCSADNTSTNEMDSTPTPSSQPSTSSEPSLEQAKQQPNPFMTLESISPSSDLVFRTNHRLIVLNDILDGSVWNPEHSTATMNIQWDTAQTDVTDTENLEGTTAHTQQEFSDECSQQSGDISAQDDHFTVRQGSRLILDVLRNDEQTDCSVLRIMSVDPLEHEDITLTPVYNGRFLQFDASASSASDISTYHIAPLYEISDGKGQTAAATITIDLTDSQQNHAPMQTDIPPEYDIEQGAVFTINALSSFSDEDNDPMTLISAQVSNTDQMVTSTRSDGQLVVHASAASNGRIEVVLTVADGYETSSGHIFFTIHQPRTLPAVIDPIAISAIVGSKQSVDLAPCIHTTSAQQPKLSTIKPVEHLQATMDTDISSVEITADKPGTHYLTYVFNQNEIESTGLIRIDAELPTDASGMPIAVNDVTVMDNHNESIVEPLSNDLDPTGGVLAITEVHTEESDSGVAAGLSAHNRIHVNADHVLSDPTTLTYTVMNSTGSSQGTIVVQPPPHSASQNLITAENVDKHIRTGGFTTVNVLDHVISSSIANLTLDTDLQYDKQAFDGLVLASDDTIRYQAGQRPGSYPLTYTVHDDYGNSASGTIIFHVHAQDSSHKPAPTPRNVEARVRAGSRIRIPIDMNGIDQDGDDIMLLGLGNIAPAKGRVVRIGATDMEYEAYADSLGTDVFSYAVEDWTGQRSQAQIRVGIFRNTGETAVFARDDEITVRPDTTVTVDVTDNDISSDDDIVQVGDIVETQGIHDVHSHDGQIILRSTDKEGTGYIVYKARNKTGVTDTALLTVTVDADLPIAAPLVQDYRVPASATIDRKSIDVDVTSLVSNPSGSMDELSVSAHESTSTQTGSVSISKPNVISIDLTQTTRTIAYTVTNTSHHASSTAFITVPAYGVFPPTLRPKAPLLNVNQGETITIPIADYIRVGVGKIPEISDPGHVSATKNANADLVVDKQTLRFTAPNDYAGPASITVEISDRQKSSITSPSNSPPIINTATLTLPITVIDDNDDRPAFTKAIIDVVAGEEETAINLPVLIADADKDRQESYRYSGGTTVNGLSSRVSSTGILTISASSTLAPGTMIGIPIEIDYGSGVLSAGVTAHIIASNRPLARLAVHDIRMAAGEQQVVDLFDGAYNPFPQKPLRATSCDIGDVQNLKVSCAENGRLAISATPDIRAGTYIITVTIRDGTDSAQREATSNISVAVTAVPNPPLLSPVSDQTLDSRVQLSWIPGESNGSPVLEYRVDYDNGHSQSCGVATTCTITGLQNGREYTFSVAARNEAGWSKPSLSVNAIPDATPTPVENITIEGGYQQATVRWSKPQFQGTAPSEYIVTISNSQGFNRTQTISDALNAIFPIDHDATGDGVTFSATVFARNRAGSSPVAQSTRTTVVWSNPDTPELQLIQEGNRLLATVRFADMHNAGCATIKLSGDVIKELDCNDPTASATIPQRFYWREMKVMASIAPRLPKAQEANTSATITPQYAVQKVSELQVFGEKDTCIVSLKPHGQYDGFVVESPKLGTQTLDADTIAARFTLQPWQQCGPVGVRQTLNGTTGPQVDAVSDYTYKIPAKITVPTLVWSQDHQHVTLSASSVNTWGQPAIIRIIITVNNQQYPYMWHPGLSSLDVGNLPESPDYPYVLDVESAAADAALHAISEIQYIEGIRKGIGMKSSNVQMDSTPWQHLQENRQIWNIIRERHHSS